MEEVNLKYIIDTKLEDLQINERLKQKLIYKCVSRQKIKINGTRKVACFLFISILLVSSLNSEQILAAIKSIFTYSTLQNKVVSLEEGLYQLDKPITLKTDKGYIKVEGCEVRRGRIEFRLSSNIDALYEEWKEPLKIRDEEGKEHSLSYHNAVGMSTSSSKETNWEIEAEGYIQGIGSRFEIITPFGEIPIECTMAQVLNDIEELGVKAYDKGIYVVARKETQGKQAVVILTAFDEQFNQIEATFDTMVYDEQGNVIEMLFGRNGKDYYNVPVEAIAEIEVLSVNKIVSYEGDELELEMPKENIKTYNKKIDIDSYKVEIIEAVRKEEGIQLKMEVKGLAEDEICYSIGCDFDFIEYTGSGGNIEGKYFLKTIYTKGEIPNAIRMKINELHINKQGKWSIKF